MKVLAGLMPKFQGSVVSATSNVKPEEKTPTVQGLTQDVYEKMGRERSMELALTTPVVSLNPEPIEPYITVIELKKGPNGTLQLSIDGYSFPFQDNEQVISAKNPVPVENMNRRNFLIAHDIWSHVLVQAQTGVCYLPTPGGEVLGGDIDTFRTDIALSPLEYSTLIKYRAEFWVAKNQSPRVLDALEKLIEVFRSADSPIGSTLELKFKIYPPDRFFVSEANHTRYSTLESIAQRRVVTPLFKTTEAFATLFKRGEICCQEEADLLSDGAVLVNSGPDFRVYRLPQKTNSPVLEQVFIRVGPENQIEFSKNTTVPTPAGEKVVYTGHPYRQPTFLSDESELPALQKPQLAQLKEAKEQFKKSFQYYQHFFEEELKKGYLPWISFDVSHLIFQKWGLIPPEIPIVLDGGPHDLRRYLLTHYQNVTLAHPTPDPKTAQFPEFPPPPFTEEIKKMRERLSSKDDTIPTVD